MYSKTPLRWGFNCSLCHFKYIAVRITKPLKTNKTLPAHQLSKVYIVHYHRRIVIDSNIKFPFSSLIYCWWIFKASLTPNYELPMIRCTLNHIDKVLQTNFERYRIYLYRLMAKKSFILITLISKSNGSDKRSLEIVHG